MTLKEKIIADFKEAFKNKEMERKTVISMLQSEIKNKEIELMKRDEGLSDEEVIAVVMRAIKQRKDSAEQYKTGGRDELYEQEMKEVTILEVYLPEQLSDDEIEKEVRGVIEQMGTITKADMGKVMGQAMAKLKGKTDGNKVRQMVERLIG